MRRPPFGEALVPGCSYVALPKAGGGTYYAYITSTGAVRMTGSLAGGGLRFPCPGSRGPASLRLAVLSRLMSGGPRSPAPLQQAVRWN